MISSGNNPSRELTMEDIPEALERLTAKTGTLRDRLMTVVDHAMGSRVGLQKEPADMPKPGSWLVRQVSLTRDVDKLLDECIGAVSRLEHAFQISPPPSAHAESA